jgi:hypothetical protein
LKNIWNRCWETPPKSLLTIGREVEEERIAKGLPLYDIEEMKGGDFK